MRYLTVGILVLFLAAAPVMSEEIEVGSSEGVSDFPWGCCVFSLRYQVLVLQEEIGSAITIDKMAFRRTDFGIGDSLRLEEPRVYLALTDADTLTDCFDTNYDPLTRDMVYSSSEMTAVAAPLEWVELQLHDDYFFPGDRNLLIEVSYSNAEADFQSCSWSANDSRALWSSDPSSVDGYLIQTLPHMKLFGSLGLQPCTFASVKKAFF